MGLLDGGMARVFAGAFRGLYLDATLHRRQLVEDGLGGGSSTWIDEPVKAQLNSVTEAMRSAEGFTDSDQRILVLADGVDLIDTDAEISVKGRRWGISSVGQDPAGAVFNLHGRDMGNVERVATGALVAVGVGGMGDAGGDGVEPFVDAYFANEGYSIDGADVAFEDIFGLVQPYPLPGGTGETGDIIPGTGWVVQKELGWGAPTGSAGPWVNTHLSAALFALLNQPGGFTAVVDFKFDNFIENMPAHHNGSISVRYGDEAFNMSMEVNGGTHYNTAHGYPGDQFLSAVSYDYDDVVPTSASDANPGFSAATQGLLILTLGETCRAYFDANLVDTVSTTDGAPYPDANATHIEFNFRATAHQGTQTDKEGVRSRTTISRLRIYQPARPEGWVPFA